LKTTRSPARFCPSCFILLDSITSVYKDLTPEAGDFSVCLKCGSVLYIVQTAGGFEYELSSLTAIPPHSRRAFARVVEAIKQKKWKPNPKPGRTQ
jgi:tRNA1(Val) A37 N6-methylase TrmN6